MRAALTAVTLLGFSLLPACGNPLDDDSSCTVGKDGTNLQMTMSGTNSQAYCSGFAKSLDPSGYWIDQPVNNGTVICRYTLTDGTVVTVRDKGALKPNENAICQQLARSPHSV